MNTNVILKELNDVVIELEKYCHIDGCEYYYQHPTACDCLRNEEVDLDVGIAWQASVILNNVMVYVRDPEHVGNFMEIARYTVTILRMAIEFHPGEYEAPTTLLRQACKIMNRIWAEKGTIVVK